jgi:hypothetical protein
MAKQHDPVSSSLACAAPMDGVIAMAAVLAAPGVPGPGRELSTSPEATTSPAVRPPVLRPRWKPATSPTPLSAAASIARGALPGAHSELLSS